ncbi:hypothetical protein [Salegentibacter maritimus]|uniref:hypothetical protein n=1 Tax=Salegentibacter maritimus TaxID=2794347 RepID=UPI0018E43FC3|nr:hypothetical protein [Salegentibacter maritimus]MBI6117253.1 hypothetical protein [Salegentibacter maritimus]
MKKTYSIILSIFVVAITAISCSKDDDSTPQLSSLAEITDFTLDFEGISADDIHYDLGTDIAVSVPFGTSLSGVIPSISVSQNATISPASGEAITFEDGEAKTFTVTAEDGSIKDYTVTINIRGEVGSGSKLETYTLTDMFGENSVSTYTYNDANFVEEISKEINDFGETSNITYAFEYNDKNQVISKSVDATDEKTVYTYENNKIVKAEYTKEGTAIYTFNYEYKENGDLASEKRIDHENDDSVDEIKFVIEDGNVVEEDRYGEVYVATYDEKNNPFIGMYPTAYAAINIGIQSVNVNNPISGTLADDTITYEYNEDGYPVSASYTYFDGLATVDKTFTYYSE